MKNNPRTGSISKFQHTQRKLSEKRPDTAQQRRRSEIKQKDLPKNVHDEQTKQTSVAQAPEPPNESVESCNSSYNISTSRESLDTVKIAQIRSTFTLRSNSAKNIALSHISEEAPNVVYSRVLRSSNFVIDNMFSYQITITLLFFICIYCLMNIIYFNIDHEVNFDQIFHIRLGFGIYFVSEVILRAFVYGKQYIFRTIGIYELTTSILMPIIVLVQHFKFSKAESNHLFVNASLLLEQVRIGSVIHRSMRQFDRIKQKIRICVSRNKKRFTNFQYDLDLTYITPNIIAMSFPSVGEKSLYRNPMWEVAKFLNERHPGKYFVFNVCREKSYQYDKMRFRNKATNNFNALDHHPLLLVDLIAFAKAAKDYLMQASDNVIAVHCRGGKGRTGTAISSLILACGITDTAGKALNLFGGQRTDYTKGSTYQGVETPSQSRYVYYYERVLTKYHGKEPPTKKLILRKMEINGHHDISLSWGLDLTIEVMNMMREPFGQEEKPVFNHLLEQVAEQQVRLEAEGDVLRINFLKDIILYRDVRIRIDGPKRLRTAYCNCVCYFMFHTSFIRRDDLRLVLHRENLDNAHKDRKFKLFSKDFSITLYFSLAPEE